MSDATAILFLVSSNEFDEYLREDFTTSRLDESCKVFETLINYRYLQEISFILFLNKYDLLKEKIKICNIMDYCFDFRGNPASLEDVKRYLSNRFSRLKKDGQTNSNNNGSVNISGSAVKYIQSNNNQTSSNSAEIYTHFTTAVDTENIKIIFEMVKNMIFENNRRVIMLS